MFKKVYGYELKKLNAKNLQSKSLIISIAVNKPMEDSNTYRMIVLEPGIHYIDKISLNKPSFDTYRYYPSPVLKDDTLI